LGKIQIFIFEVKDNGNKISLIVEIEDAW